VPAELSLRFFAYFADWIIVIVGEAVIVLLFAALEKILLFTGSNPVAVGKTMTSLQYPAVAILIIAPWLYHAVLESSARMGTFGKMMFEIAVTDLAGQKISFFKASLRYWAKVLSTLCLFLGFLPAFFTKNKRAFHDFAAGTIVAMTGKVTE
jgi:uncharacterized RDD family membrane protein YckC